MNGRSSEAELLKILRDLSPVSECWALDRHWDGARGTRTSVGWLVRRAKQYTGGPAPERAAADELASLMGKAAHNRAARIRECDVVVPVPANPPKPHYNLPDVLADRVAESIRADLTPALVKKVRETREVKFLPQSEKRAAISGAFEVEGELSGEAVLLVDDLFLSGTTLQLIAERLIASGASMVIGYVATQATRGMTTS